MTTESKDKSADKPKNHSDKRLIRAVLIVLALLDIFILIYQYQDANWLGSFVSKLLKGADLLGFNVAILTFWLAYYITILIEKQKNVTEKQRDDLMKDIQTRVRTEFERLINATKKIDEATENLQDASRRILDNFPDILEKALEIVKSKRKQGYLHMLNFTSLFGKIHTYNKSILQQFMKKNRDEFPRYNEPTKEDYELAITKMSSKIKDLERFLLDRTEEMENIQIAILDAKAGQGKNLNDLFIERYFDGNREKLVIHDMIKSGIYKLGKEITELSEKEIVEWKDCIIKDHNKSASKLWHKRKEEKYDEKKFLRYTEYVPFQMYLGENYTGTDEKDNECLIIFVNNSNVGKGEIMGIYSKNPRMFSAFRFIFDDVFNHAKPPDSDPDNNK